MVQNMFNTVDSLVFLIQRVRAIVVIFCIRMAGTATNKARYLVTIELSHAAPAAVSAASRPAS